MALPLLVKVILPELLVLLQSYLKWSREAPRSLVERERRLRAMFEAMAQVILAQDARADELRVRPPECECGGRLQSKGLRKRTLVTTVGTVTFRRRYYTCDTCQAHRLPVDEAWGVESGCLSPELKAVGVDLASALPFREARWWLNRLGGLRISLSTLWRATQEAGAELVTAQAIELEKQKEIKGAAAFLSLLRGKGASGRWALAVDGLFLRVEREWREVKVAVMGQLNDAGDWQRQTASYVASSVPAHRFRALVVTHAVRRGITRQTALVILSDGAAWIRAFSRSFPQATLIRDWWHTVEYLWQAAKAIHGDNPQAASLVEALKSILWEGKVLEVRERLAQDRTGSRLRGERKTKYDGAVGYLEHHQGAMRYADYRAERWPLGSGSAESTCKLIQARMKRSGMNWSSTGVENMLTLRADYCGRLNASLYPHS